MSVCIQVTQDYRITSDPLQWIIQKFSHVEKTGAEKWKPVGYYVSPEQAINGLYKLLLRESDATTLAELRETSEKLAVLLHRARTTAVDISADVV